MPSSETDIQLVSQFREGEDRAFNEIVLRYQERLYWVARRFVGSHEAADDIVQDVFIKAHESLKEFRGDSSLYTWLYRITVNFSLNEIRRQRVKSFLRLDDAPELREDEAGSPDVILEEGEKEKLILEAVAKLPEKQKRTFILRYFEEMPYEEMAKILNTSVGGLKANYFHAVRKVGAYLKSAHRGSFD